MLGKAVYAGDDLVTWKLGSRRRFQGLLWVACRLIQRRPADANARF